VKFCKEVRLFRRRTPWSLPNILRAGFSHLPFAAATYWYPQFRKALRQELAAGASGTSGKYDWVYFDSFYPAVYLPFCRKLGVRTLLGNTNVEWRLFQRYVNNVKFLPWRWLMRVDIWKMRRFEEKLWRLADVNTSVSEKDAKEIKGATGRACVVVSMGEFEKVAREKDNVRRIMFIGTLIYNASSDAMRYFLRDIYPLVKQQIPDIHFRLVSWHEPAWLKGFLGDPSIEFVKDSATPVPKFLAQTDILVAPLRVAGGTNIKILEAFAAGVPVVTTKFGLEGIDAEPGRHLLVADTPAEFAAAVRQLLESKTLRDKMGKAARRLVAERYDWQQSAQTLNQILSQA